MVTVGDVDDAGDDTRRAMMVIRPHRRGWCVFT